MDSDAEGKASEAFDYFKVRIFLIFFSIDLIFYFSRKKEKKEIEELSWDRNK